MENKIPDHEEERSEETLRNDLYKRYNVSKTTQIGIEYILPRLDRNSNTEERYDIDPHSKILAEISLFEAYQREPKFKMFAIAGIILLAYDILHILTPAIYGVVFIALATVNGFASALRSPAMMAAELEGKTDKDGIPANYRAKALSSVNTNVTLVLFVIAVSIQLLVTSSIIEGELITRNLADGTVNPRLTGGVLILLPLLYSKIHSS